jgi:hypothetical protein
MMLQSIAPFKTKGTCVAITKKQRELLEEAVHRKRNHRRLLTVHELDKSTDRYKLLKRRMDGLVPQGMVRCYNMDFLQVKPSYDRGRNDDDHGDHHDNHDNRDDGNTVTGNFRNVQAIQLDPSCFRLWHADHL